MRGDKVSYFMSKLVTNIGFHEFSSLLHISAKSLSSFKHFLPVILLAASADPEPNHRLHWPHGQIITYQVWECMNTFNVPASHWGPWSWLEARGAASSDLRSENRKQLAPHPYKIKQTASCGAFISGYWTSLHLRQKQTPESQFTWGSCFIWATSFCRRKAESQKPQDHLLVRARYNSSSSILMVWEKYHVVILWIPWFHRNVGLNRGLNTEACVW